MSVMRPSMKYRYSDSGRSSEDVPLQDLSDYGDDTQSQLFIPPPPVTSFSVFSAFPNRSMLQDPLHALQEQTNRLQMRIQQLLDAQASALMEGNYTDDATSTSSMDMYASVATVRPGMVKSKIGLGAARTGILKAMKELGEIKAREQELHQAEVEKRSVEISQLQEWMKRKRQLEEDIAKLENGTEGKRLNAISTEIESVENEILSLRTRLENLEIRREQLLNEAKRLESTISAKTGSYRESLDTLNRTTSKYLGSLNPPTMHPQAALEHWDLERKAFMDRLEKAKAEQEACQDGMTMWKDVLTLVRNFERSLAERTQRIQSASTIMSGSSRSRTRGLGTGRRNDLSPSEYAMSRSTQMSPVSGTATPEERRLLREVEDIATQLESRKNLAEIRGWKLLVCCISAELEAFRQAQEVLASQVSLPVSETRSPRSPQSPQSPRLLREDEEEEMVDFLARPRDSGNVDKSGAEEIHELDQAFQSTLTMNADKEDS